MFYASMGGFQLELIYCFIFILHRRSSSSCMFLSCRPIVVNTTFSAGLVGVEVTLVILDIKRSEFRGDH